jgi:ABC-type transport system substrate-binding protein
MQINQFRRRDADTAERWEIYGKALDIAHEDLRIIYLFNGPMIMALRRNLECFTLIPDGSMRLGHVRLAG